MINIRRLVISEGEEQYRRAVYEAVGRFQGDRLVDLGGGDGSESAILRTAARARELICVDTDGKALKKAKAKGCLTLQADLNQKLPLPESSADIVVANQLIEHLPETDNLLKNIFRVLKPGGVTVICTPNLASWHNIASLIFGWQPFAMQISNRWFLGNPLHPLYQQPTGTKRAHLRVFTHRSLKELIIAYGLTVIEDKGVGYYPWPKPIAKFLSRIDRCHSTYILITAQKLRNEIKPPVNFPKI
jgi:SAM-dependent methyltransferase